MVRDDPHNLYDQGQTSNACNLGYDKYKLSSRCLGSGNYVRDQTKCIHGERCGGILARMHLLCESHVRESQLQKSVAEIRGYGIKTSKEGKDAGIGSCDAAMNRSS